MGPAVLVVADGDANRAQREADRFAARVWDMRAELTRNLPEPATAVAEALKSERRPVVLVDTGDNIGGGSPATALSCWPSCCVRGQQRASSASTPRKR